MTATPHILAGAAIGKVLRRPWLAWPGTAWLSVFHHSFQHNVTPAQWPLGIATQLVVVAIALWVCLPRKHKDLQPSAENT